MPGVVLVPVKPTPKEGLPVVHGTGQRPTVRRMRAVLTVFKGKSDASCLVGKFERYKDRGLEHTWRCTHGKDWETCSIGKNGQYVKPDERKRHQQQNPHLYWSCHDGGSGNCERMLAAESVKHLCAPTNRWIFYGGNSNTCYSTCAQAAEKFCKDNNCSGYTLLVGEAAQNKGNNEFIREEAIYLNAWELTKGKGASVGGGKKAASAACILTKGNRRKRVYAPDRQTRQGR